MSDWKKYLEKPVPLRLYVMHTGEVRSVGTPHYNPKSPKFKDMPKSEGFNPVFAYLVEHPTKGLLLLDTGLHHSFADSKSGNFGIFLGALVSGRTERGKDVLSQLKAIDKGVQDVRYVLLSHLHLDHVSGLPYFKGSNVEVFVDREELHAARAPLSSFKGYIKAHLNGINCRPIPYVKGAPPFELIYDFFADGSLFVVRTAGHTKGHCSVLLNADYGPILLAFDAIHRKSNLDGGIPPSGDYTNALSAMKSIESFVARFPKTKVIFGHDAGQLRDLVLAPKYYA